MKQRPTRRRFLQSSVAAAGGAMLLGGKRSEAHPHDRLPDPERSGIEHVVVVMMENRSFDHLLGWLPGANGRQAGFTFEDPSGARHKTFKLAPTIGFQGCNNLDPDHSWEGGRTQVNGGRMDGWLKANSDVFSIGYYERKDRPFFNELAMKFTTLDRYHCSILAETFPNRFFQHSAQTPVLHNREVTVAQTVPTIWDNLAAAGLSGKYYFTDVPFVAVWGNKYLPIAHTFPEFLADAAAGTLPAVSFLDPKFQDEGQGTSGDDHPHADIRVGDAFMSQAFHAVANGPGWAKTVFVITYDEWGGFFDHVVPPRSVAANDVDPPDDDGEVLLGIRVPTIVASPWTHGDDVPRIHSHLFDHTSVLKLIEWRWRLPHLTLRDAPDSNITNLAHVLDFRRHNPRVPELPTPTAPVIEACPPAFAGDQLWKQLRESPVAKDWKL
jgi:phospholipase C